MPSVKGDFPLLYDLLSTHKKIALAVSGGSDSSALMTLAAKWARTNGRLDDICVLTVDHALRDGSASEAQQVCQWASALGFKSQILTWYHDGQTTGIQAKARSARYQLMADWCRDNGHAGIITAHTADDQAETVLMRLARGSGVDGLAAMNPRAEIYGTVVFRPLLGISRKTLRDVLKSTDHNWLEDPSNNDQKFERVRVRGAMDAIEKIGIDQTALNLSAKRLNRAKTALNTLTDQFMTSSVTVYNTGHCEIDRPAFETLPDEIAIRALARLVQWAGGAPIAARLAKIERLFEDIRDTRADKVTLKMTLGGAQLAMRKTSIVIGREYGRIEPTLARQVNQWDNRFVFTKAQDVQPYGIFINDDSRERVPKLPHFVACSLPAFSDPTGIITVPHLDGNSLEMAKLSALPVGINKSLSCR